MTKIILTVPALVAMFAVTAANAHAMLDHADPRVGSTVSASPRELVLWFSEQLEPAFSTVEVRNGSGARVDAGKAQLSHSNRTELHVPLKSLPPGSYRVFWRVLSVDTHRTQGNFSFRVGP